MSVVLLTGGSGFVGRQIHKRLVSAGHDVRLVLRPGSQARLAVAAAPENIIESDDLFAERHEWWARACEGAAAVIHAAWYVEPGLYLDAPENAHCVAGSFALAQGGTAAGVKHFIGIGTCFEYRLPSKHLDVDAPLAPATLYAASKVATYLMWREWFAKHGPTFSWCRLFYLFGEGEHPSRLTPYISKCLAAGETANLSAGTQVRDFLDVAKAGAMVADVVDTGQSGAINVCSGSGTTIREFAERIADAYGRRDLLRFGAARVHPSDPSEVVGVCNAIGKRRSGEKE